MTKNKPVPCTELLQLAQSSTSAFTIILKLLMPPQYAFEKPLDFPFTNTCGVISVQLVSESFGKCKC